MLAVLIASKCDAICGPFPLAPERCGATCEQRPWPQLLRLQPSPSRLTSRYTRHMSAQDLELIALIDRAQASGATSATALMEGFVYGNLKIEYPSAERETVVAVVRDYLRER